MQEMSLTNWSAVEYQIVQTEQILENITGQRPYLIRPPYGSLNPLVQQYLESRDYTIAQWSNGDSDWFFVNSTLINQDILSSMCDSGNVHTVSLLDTPT